MHIYFMVYHAQATFYHRYPDKISITLKVPDSKKKMKAKNTMIWMKRKSKERPIPGYSQAAMLSVQEAQYPPSRAQISAVDMHFYQKLMGYLFDPWLVKFDKTEKRVESYKDTSQTSEQSYSS